MEQCKKCALAGECHRVWKNTEAPNVTCVSYTPTKTKADEIRAMDDRELAEFLFSHGGSAPNCNKNELAFDYKHCEDCWLEWLKQEAEEGER